MVALARAVGDPSQVPLAIQEQGLTTTIGCYGLPWHRHTHIAQHQLAPMLHWDPSKIGAPDLYLFILNHKFKHYKNS